MEGSFGEEHRLLVRSAFVTGAIRLEPPSVKARMKGIHETIEEACHKRGIDAFVPFLLALEDQHVKEMTACDLVIVEATFHEPRLEVQIGTAKSLRKPILYLYEEASMISRLRRQNESPKWKLEYVRYPVLSKLLDAWFAEYATCPKPP
jgi:hypothetical protein